MRGILVAAETGNTRSTAPPGFRLASPAPLTPPKRLNMQHICLICSIRLREVNPNKTKAWAGADLEQIGAGWRGEAQNGELNMFKIERDSE